MRLLLLILAFAVEGFGQDLLLQNAQIVDPAAEKIHRGAILIRDGRIAEILAAVPKNFKGEQIDLAGKWVLPGLNDMHVHSYGNLAPANNMQLLMTPGVAKMMLYCGVTGFLDLFSAESEILRLRDQQRQSGLPGATLISNSADFQELKLPFAQFKQFWSAPLAWTGKDVRGVAFWVSGFQPADFEFVIDQIEFY